MGDPGVATMEIVDGDSALAGVFVQLQAGSDKRRVNAEIAAETEERPI